MEQEDSHTIFNLLGVKEIDPKELPQEFGFSESATGKRAFSLQIEVTGDLPEDGLAQTEDLANRLDRLCGSNCVDLNSGNSYDGYHSGDHPAHRAVHVLEHLAVFRLKQSCHLKGTSVRAGGETVTVTDEDYPQLGRFSVLSIGIEGVEDYPMPSKKDVARAIGEAVLATEDFIHSDQSEFSAIREKFNL